MEIVHLLLIVAAIVCGILGLANWRGVNWAALGVLLLGIDLALRFLG